MLKFLKRIIIFVFVSFIFFNLVLFFAVNDNTVQKLIVKYINNNYFAKQNFSLYINSFSSDLFFRKITIDQGNIEEVFPSGEKFIASIGTLSFSVDLVKSYLERKIILKNVILENVKISSYYDKNKKVLLPFFLSFKKNDNPINITNFLKENKNLIPFSLNIVNASIVLKSNSEENNQNIFINQVRLKKIDTFSYETIFSFDSSIKNTVLYFPKMKEKIDLMDLTSSGNISTNGHFSITELNIKSNLLNLSSRFDGIIKEDIKKSSYYGHISSLEIKANPVFKEINFKSNGDIKIAGDVQSDKDFFSLPIFTGKLDWKNLSLEQFDIYSGHADFQFVNRKITYQNAVVKTYKNGIIFARGEYCLYDNFYFENKAIINNLSFAELLKGLGVKGSPIDFQLQSKEVMISGFMISRDLKKNFELFANGKINTKNLLITNLKNLKNNKILPEMNIDLKLQADANKVSFAKSEIFLLRKNKDVGSIKIPKGFLDLTPRIGIAAFFDIYGTKVDFYSLGYFIGGNPSGTGNIEGSIKVYPNSSNVTFSGEGFWEKGIFYGITFKNFFSKFKIDNNGIVLTNTKVISGEETNSFFLGIKSLVFKYNNNIIYVNGRAQGDISSVYSSLKNWIPNGLQKQINGKIRALSFSIDGPLFSPFQWNMQASSVLENIDFMNISIKKMSALFQCKMGSCFQSYLTLDSINDKILTGKNRAGTKSFMLLEIPKLSLKDVDLKLKIQDFPINGLSFFLGKQISGLASLNGNFSGKWEDLKGGLEANFKNVIYNDLKINNFKVQLNREKKDNWFNLKLVAFQNQFRLSYIFSTKRNDILSSISVSLQNFDPTIFLSEKIRNKLNLYGSINGNFLFEGPSLWEKTTDSFLENWQGGGRISYGIIQFGKEIFYISEKNKFSISKDILKIENLKIESNLLEIKSEKLDIDLNRATIFTNLFLTGNLNNLSEIISTPDGKFFGNATISGKLLQPEITSSLSLNVPRLTLVSTNTEIKNFSAVLYFNNYSLEIRKAEGNIDDGNVSAVGNIDFLPMIHEQKKFPRVFLKLIAKNARFRLPVPVFLAADIDATVDLTLTGDKKPYLLQGNIELNKMSLFRNLSCTEISGEILSYKSKMSDNSQTPFANLNVNLKAIGSIHIQSQCLNGRFSTQPVLTVLGNTLEPLLSGTVVSDESSINLLKSRFIVDQADLSFIPSQRYDPNVEIHLESRLSSYIIYFDINGRLSSARINLSVDPSTLENGDAIAQGDIISMISTGQVPAQSTSSNLLSASSSVFSFLGVGNFLTNTLNKTLNAVTGGIVDTISISPVSENGEINWKATLSRSVSRRFDLGITYKYGAEGTEQSAYGTFLLNNFVGIFSSWDRSAFVQQQLTSELFGGLRFRLSGN